MQASNFKTKFYPALKNVREDAFESRNVKLYLLNLIQCGQVFMEMTESHQVAQHRRCPHPCLMHLSEQKGLRK